MHLCRKNCIFISFYASNMSIAILRTLPRCGSFKAATAPLCLAPQRMAFWWICNMSQQPRNADGKIARTHVAWTWKNGTGIGKVQNYFQKISTQAFTARCRMTRNEHSHAHNQRGMMSYCSHKCNTLTNRRLQNKAHLLDKKYLFFRLIIAY